MTNGRHADLRGGRPVGDDRHAIGERDGIVEPDRRLISQSERIAVRRRLAKLLRNFGRTEP